MPLGQRRNNPGKGAALGLLSEKLVAGIGNRRKNRKTGQQQQTLTQKSLPQKTSLEKKPSRDAEAVTTNAAQSSQSQSHMQQVQALMKSKSEQSSNRNRSGAIAATASALK